MTSLTHISFGILFTEFMLTSLGVKLSAPVLALSGISSLLPDIDTPKSALGRVFPFSSLIEQRYGHRQITHSWIFIVISLFLFSPVMLLSHGYIKYAGIIMGIVSHIMIDMVNLSGVPLFYPSPARFVFPSDKSSRIEVNSRREYILLAMLLFFVAITTPLSFIGYKSLFYRLAQTPYSAIEEAKNLSEDYSLKVKVSGIWRKSQVRVDDEFNVLAVQGSGLIVQAGDGRVFFLSNSYHSAIVINRIGVYTIEKTEKSVTSKKYSYCLFDSIDIPRNSIISGYIFYEGYENIKDVLWSFDEDEYEVIKTDPGMLNKIVLSYCPDTFLRKLYGNSLFVSYADLTITELRRLPCQE
jgi:inner membrane protein